MDSHASLDRIKDFLGNGDTEAAADLLLKATKSFRAEHYRSALLLKNRIETLQHNSIEGVLSTDEERLEWARISRGIINLVEQIERNESPQPLVAISPTPDIEPVPTRGKIRTRWVWWALPGLLLLGAFLFPKAFEKKQPPSVRENAHLQGQLIWFDNSPVPHATLTVESLDQQYTATTDDNGNFTLQVDSACLNRQVNISVSVDGNKKTETIRLTPEHLKPYTLSK